MVVADQPTNRSADQPIPPPRSKVISAVPSDSAESRKFRRTTSVNPNQGGGHGNLTGIGNYNSQSTNSNPQDFRILLVFCEAVEDIDRFPAGKINKIFK